MIFWIVGIIIALVIISGLMKGWREARAKRKKVTIPSPKAGIFNLSGESAESFIESDRKFLEPIFGNIEENNSAPPQCDVLFIYCNVEIDGRIGNYEDSLRSIIEDSSAKIIVIATDNPADNYSTAAEIRSFGQANLVMTRNRKGDSFAIFFERLFKKMMEGSTMPIAWDELAPQKPGSRHKDCPGTMFICEAGHLSFK